MAATSESPAVGRAAPTAVPPRPATGRLPKRLPMWQVYVLRAAMPLFAVMLVLGCLGVWILTDTDSKWWISRTTFADWYRWLIMKNAFFSAFFLNGGFLGLAMSYKNLCDHAAAAPPPEEKKLSRQERRHPEKAELLERKTQ